MLRTSLTVFMLLFAGFSAKALERIDLDGAQLQAQTELRRLENESAQRTKKRLEDELRGLETPAPIEVPASQTARANQDTERLSQ